jgi:hypothetical protein
MKMRDGLERAQDFLIFKEKPTPLSRLPATPEYRGGRGMSVGVPHCLAFLHPHR